MICNYCGKLAEYIDSKEIYGKSYGMIYICRPCDAYVGVHEGTTKPKGKLANLNLRRLRIRAHKEFDTIWKEGEYKGRRNDAYTWLANKMNLKKQDTHIGMFNENQCRKVISIMRKKK